VRTPKKGSREGRYRTRAALPKVEIALALLSMVSVVVSFETGHWFAVPFAGLFTFGYGYVALLVASEQATHRRRVGVAPAGGERIDASLGLGHRLGPGRDILGQLEDRPIVGLDLLLGVFGHLGQHVSGAVEA
jgi:hypothetical protein